MTVKRIKCIDYRFLREKLTFFATNGDNSPLSEWIAQEFVITVISATERILPVFVREAKAL
jgi:hypothetical protein